MDVLDKKANDRSMVLRDMPKCRHSYYSDNQQHNHRPNNGMSRSAMLLPMLFYCKKHFDTTSSKYIFEWQGKGLRPLVCGDFGHFPTQLRKGGAS